jgi:hypothetical protein
MTVASHGRLRRHASIDARGASHRRNEKALFRIRPLRAAPVTSLSREFHSEIFVRSANNRFTDSGNDADLRLAQKEIAMAQDSMLNGKMGACGMHLSKAMHDAGMAK